MKTERRHELQTNDLAEWLGKHIEQVQPYSKTILAVLLLVVAGAIVGTYLMRDQAAQAQLGWNDFYSALGQRSSQALGEVAERHAGSEAGLWALLAESDIQLSDGLDALYRDRDQAKELLQAAKRGYQLVEENAQPRLLKQRAWFGLGQVHEALAELDKATDYYGRLASLAPTSALGKEAQKRIEALKDPGVEKWYNWFANQKPRPMSSPGFPGGAFPGMPDDLGALPDRPDLSLPGASALPPLEGATTTAADKADDAPAPNNEEPSPASGSPPAPQKQPPPENSDPTAQPATTPDDSEGPAAEPEGDASVPAASEEGTADKSDADPAN